MDVGNRTLLRQKRNSNVIQTRQRAGRPTQRAARVAQPEVRGLGGGDPTKQEEWDPLAATKHLI